MTNSPEPALCSICGSSTFQILRDGYSLFTECTDCDEWEPLPDLTQTSSPG